MSVMARLCHLESQFGRYGAGKILLGSARSGREWQGGLGGVGEGVSLGGGGRKWEDRPGGVGLGAEHLLYSNSRPWPQKPYTGFSNLCQLNSWYKSKQPHSAGWDITWSNNPYSEVTSSVLLTFIGFSTVPPLSQHGTSLALASFSQWKGGQRRCNGTNAAYSAGPVALVPTPILALNAQQQHKSVASTLCGFQDCTAHPGIPL